MPTPERRRVAERQPLATAAFWAAAGSYTANCALGAATASGRVQSRHRWWHHALYVTTAALTAVALSTAVWTRPRRYRAAAALLLPAAVPLAVIPFADARGIRHPLIALSAAPFFAAGAARAT